MEKTYFLKHIKPLLILAIMFFCSLVTFAQKEPATKEQKLHAYIITDGIRNSSIARRDSFNNGSAVQLEIPQGNESDVTESTVPAEGNENWNIEGPDVASRLSVQTFYLSPRADTSDWWYISSGNVVSYYDDMITIQFNTNASFVDVIYFRKDFQFASKRIKIEGDSIIFSPGKINTGDQSIWDINSAANLLGTLPQGGNCNSYEYQWQYLMNGEENYTDIINATSDSLIVAPALEIFFQLDKDAIYFRRRVICGADTLYTGTVAIYQVRPLTPGTIITPDQTVIIGETAETLKATNAEHGECNQSYQYQWQYSNDNNNYTDISGEQSDSLKLDNSIDRTTYFRRKVTCGNSTGYSNSTTVYTQMPTLRPGTNTYISNAVKPLPPVYLSNQLNYQRTFIPNKPIQDTALVNMASLVEDVSTSTVYADSYGRTLQVIAKQASPLKSDYVTAAYYDQFGRPSLNYLPFVANTSNTDDGNFKMEPFFQDSIFYKTLFPNEQVNYSEVIYDGSPFNIPVMSMAQGNSWGGSSKGVSYTYRTNNIEDSVRYWTIGINNEDDVPQTAGFYELGSLSVQEIMDESGMKSVKFVDEIGRTVLTKTLLRGKIKFGAAAWLCTYYVYDEMNHLRMVIPPKAVHALNTPSANWDLSGSSTINANLCYAYYYDQLGRNIAKRIPGKGKSYIAYDLFNRVVMTQDPNLRNTNQWAFVLYDAQSRPVKSGVITSALTKDQVITQAAASMNYPSLAGTTNTITSETYYDDYSWIASAGAPVSATLDETNINNSNFITDYNTAPDYAQPLVSSKRIRGAVTGSKQIILNSSQYLYTVKFYDGFSRPVQTIQSNYSGGIDVATTQFSFSGRLLRSHLKHEKSGANAQTHTVLNKYSYDHTGRLIALKKNFDNLGDKQVSFHHYNEMGQLQDKVFGDHIESQRYSYNIRGWLLGINEGFVNSPYAPVPGENGSNYFGEMISYDKGFTNAQYNGNIAGIQWKAGGDRVARAYGFVYDNANRLIHADFSQQNTGSTQWTKDKVDYSVSNLTYDGNGNILTMTQRGLKLGGSSIIDSLSYQYFTNSNLLQKVSDASTDISPLGDFKDTTSTGDDYTYDANGNINRDNNRKMHGASATPGAPGAVFNLLDKPDSIVIAGKSGTHYYYDASGITLRKQINEYTQTGTIVKNYVYINGFVYLNDTLQYALYEEGSIRYAKKRNSQTGETYYAYEYDYFIKDHQGNVRTVLTEGKDTATYQATMEPARQAIEDALFANVYTPVNTIQNKPAGFDTENTNEKVSRLNGSAGSNLKTGPSLVLKVMAGDKVQMNTYAWYNTPAQQPQSGINLLTEILSVLPGAVIGTGGSKLAAGNTALLGSTLSPNVTQFLNNNRPYDNTKPKAYLNWILFDEQFNFVASNSGVKQVEAGTEKQALVAPLQTIGKNGFLYIYVSNESPQDVYFDDLTVQHFTGPLTQEQSFYPFGLQMAAISSKALLKTVTPYKYNGGNELEEEGSLNYYNTFYRKYDAQIGRFTGVDIRSEESYGMSVYNFGANNPIYFNDPLGDMNKSPFRLQKDPNGEYHVGWVTEMLWNNIGFFNMYEGPGGASGGEVVYHNLAGISSKEILDNLKFGDRFGKNKNGVLGYFIHFSTYINNDKKIDQEFDKTHGQQNVKYEDQIVIGIKFLPYYDNKLVGTPWISFAESQLGIREATGNNDGIDVVKYLKSADLGAGHPWCGAFVNWSFSQAGMNSVKNPAWALNWRKYGNSIERPAYGSIGTLIRPGGGHVGFVVANDQERQGWVIMLGGNQDDQVSYRSFPVSIMKFNYPTGFSPSYVLPVMNNISAGIRMH